MLKNMVKNIRDNFKYGMFKNHFMWNLIDNQQDKQSFYVYYQDRLGAVALAALLDLDFNADGEKLAIKSPVTGKSTELTFRFSPPFKNIEYENTFLCDVDSLTETRDFLHNEIKAKFPDSPEFQDVFGALYFVVSYLLDSSSSDDQFIIQKLGELLTCAKNRLYLSRPQTTSYDQDVIMASAWKNIHFVTSIAQLPKHKKDRFTAQELVCNMNDILNAEFQLSLNQRQYERAEARKLFNDERRTTTSSFWSYKKMCENFTNTPEMW